MQGKSLEVPALLWGFTDHKVCAPGRLALLTAGRVLLSHVYVAKTAPGDLTGMCPSV